MLRNVIRPLKLLRSVQLINQCESIRVNKPFRYHFAVRKQTRQENLGSIRIKNDNLKFNSEGYDILFHPFHPEIVKKTSTNYQINRNSHVVTLNFVPKTQSGSQVTNQKSKSNWQNRKSISFRFNQLAKLIQVNPEQERTFKVEVTRSYDMRQGFVKELSFRCSKNQTRLTLEQFSLENNAKVSKGKIQTKIQNSEVQMLIFLVKESLYDLSGMRFMFDLKRNQQLAKIGEKDKTDIEKEDLFKNYDSKDSVV